MRSITAAIESSCFISLLTGWSERSDVDLFLFLYLWVTSMMWRKVSLDFLREWIEFRVAWKIVGVLFFNRTEVGDLYGKSLRLLVRRPALIVRDNGTNMINWYPKALLTFSLNGI